MTKFNIDVTDPQAAFLEWALKQSSENLINHSDWRSCAVGNYHSATGGALTVHLSTGYDHPAGFYNWSEYAEHILPKKLWSILNADGRSSGWTLLTYGDLQAFIHHYYVENDDESKGS